MSGPVGREAMAALLRSCERERLSPEDTADRVLGLLSSDAAWARAFGHPLRGEIMGLLHREGPMSPVQASAELDASLGTTSYHFRILQRLGVIEVVREEQRRGAVEHFYQLVDGGGDEAASEGRSRRE